MQYTSTPQHSSLYQEYWVGIQKNTLPGRYVNPRKYTIYFFVVFAPQIKHFAAKKSKTRIKFELLILSF